MGNNSNGQLGLSAAYNELHPTVPNPMNITDLNFQRIARIRAGLFSAALSQDNQLFVWGRGTFGEFFLPHRVKAASLLDIMDFKLSKAGMGAILTHQGQVYSWGENKHG